MRRTAVFAVLSLLLTSWVAYQAGKKEGMRHRCEKHWGDKAFVLAVTLQFRTLEERDRLLPSWQKLATHVQQHEPDALSYKWLVADTDPTKVLVYERYRRKEAYTGPHRSSKPFFAFKEAQQSIPMEISGQSYLETDFGFM